MKNCPNCNHQNPEDAKFCEACGAALSITKPQPPPGSSNTVAEGAKVGLGILSFLIPLVGIILGISYMNDPEPAKKAAGKTYLYLGIGGIVLGCILAALAGGAGY